MGISSKMCTAQYSRPNIMHVTPALNVRHTFSKRRVPNFNIKLNSDKSYIQLYEPDSPTTSGTKITDRIYITDASQATNQEFLKNNQITAIITLSVHRLPTRITALLKDYKFVEIADNCKSNIQLYFNDCIDFINKNIKNGKVLVHCDAGISRSATIVIAYLMKTNNWSWREACDFVQERRSCIAPNFSFIGQLLNFESTMNI